MSTATTGLDESGAARLANRFRSLAAGLSLRQRILLIVCLAALPGIAVAFSLAASKIVDQTRQIELTVERLARIGAAQHDVVLEKARVLLEAVAARGGACEAAVASLPKDQTAFTGIAIFGADGKLLCGANPEGIPADASRESWFAKGREARKFVLGAYAVGAGGKAVVTAALPLSNPDGSFAGFAALGIDMRWIDFVAATVKLPERMTISAFDAKGTLLSHNFASQDTGTKEAAAPSQPSREQMASLPEGVLRADDTSGSPRVYGFKATESGGLVIAVGSPRYAEHVEYGDALLSTVAAPLTVLALALLAAGFAAEMFVARYVRSLTRSTEAVAAGDLSERSDVPYDEHEIGELAEAFDDMVETLEDEQGSLSGQVERGDVLIRELNHRVKNNFQMVLSMLEIGSRRLSPEDAQERLKGLSGRVMALAEIHRLLYEEYNDKSPNLGHFIRELARLLGRVYRGATDVRIRIDASAADAFLSIAHSISLGLILNELISNAHKHAFRPGRSGRVTISLKKATSSAGDGDRVKLSVTDDGKGVPDGFDMASNGSTGLRLIAAL
ncbi:MAG: histidine kinase dimerization/phosphoacceptor domain -containing protein, partial [Pseudomonadota bacterium]|nr:histidine kinase dimerization/phosphoacceptor domain -containing protein [Pseudomonadota bacterium]